MCPAPWNSDPLPRAHQSATPTLLAESDLSVMGVATRQPMRSRAVTHVTVDAPICVECQALEMTFFDPTCKGCKRELESSEAQIAHIFAVLRQWVPQVQQNIEFLVSEALRRGAHPDDRDRLTDMTLLMYACKAGANGVGDMQAAARVSQTLIELGADLSLRCKWTHMSALHYAAYFDVAPVMAALLMKSKGSDVDTPCREYENGGALHIAAANLSVSAARVLLKFGADPEAADELLRAPRDCIPEPDDFALIPDADELVGQMERILAKGGVAGGVADGDDEGEGRTAATKVREKGRGGGGGGGAISGRTVLKALGLKVGDRVLVGGGTKLGTLRYCGTTDFAAGVWAGVALDGPEGKNDGSVKGVMYFRCQQNHGVFVPANKVAKVGKNYRDPSNLSVSGDKSVSCSNLTRPSSHVVNHGKVDISHVSSRLTECLTVIEEKQEIRVGDRVRVDVDNGRKDRGTVRYVGEVDFIQDGNRWYGIEMDDPVGRHDGTVQGVRYFAASPNTGIFVAESKLAKIFDANNVANVTAAASREDVTATPTFSATPRRAGSRADLAGAERERRRSLSSKHRGNKANIITNSHSHSTERLASNPTSPVPSSVGGRSSRNAVSAASAANAVNAASAAKDGGEWQTVSAMQFNKFVNKKMPKKYLDVGTSVICVHNKEMGVVKYVGRVSFADGIWAGLELRQARGKHDGQVEGRRYFTCKPNHGVLLRPKKLSVHGINGQDLLKPEHEYPF